MNRRHASAAVVLGSAAVFLATACGPSDSSPSAAASSPAASTAAGSAGSAGSTASSAPSGTSATQDPAAPTAASGGAGGGRKPCSLPAGYGHFLHFDSAEVYQGDTVVRVTPETCGVNPNNDEDVSYTPIEASRSFTVPSGASVKVLSGTGAPDSVTPRWLVDNKLVNSPYFYYRLNSQNQITAMQEIYHP